MAVQSTVEDDAFDVYNLEIYINKVNHVAARKHSRLHIAIAKSARSKTPSQTKNNYSRSQERIAHHGDLGFEGRSTLARNGRAAEWRRLTLRSSDVVAPRDRLPHGRSQRRHMR